MKKIVTLGVALAIFVIIAVFGIIGFFSFFNSGVNAMDKEEILKELPDLNERYILYQRDIEQGAYIDLCDIPEDVYLRPEFYKEWERFYNSRYKSHSYIRWITNGYGTYPSGGISLGNLKKGEEIKVCTFIKSSYGTETFIGIKLIPIKNKYFETVLQPSIFLLEPTFPRFRKGWARRIEVVFRAKKNVPIGTYNLGFNVGKPPRDIEIMFGKEVSKLDLEDRDFYRDSCEKDMENLGIPEEDKYDCEEISKVTQNKYINGGDYNNGINTYSYTIEVVSE